MRKFSIVIMVMIMVLSSSFVVFADSTVVNFRYAEPAKSSQQGYLVVRTGANNNFCFFWSINPKTGDGAADSPCTSSMNLIINDDSIVFTPLTTGGVSASYHITSCSTSGNIVVRASGNMDSSADSYTFNADISEVCYYGNVGLVDYNLSSGTSKWLRVNWGDDNDMNSVASDLSSVLDELNDIYSRLGTINSNVVSLGDMEALLDDIVNSLVNVEGDVSDVKTSLEEISQDTAYLSSIDNRLNGINYNTQFIYSRLDDIYGYLQTLGSMEGSSDTSTLDDSNINELGEYEQEAIFDASEELDNLSFNFGDSFGFVWEIISYAWQTNAKVFTVVIMCLTVGLLKLIFNR